MFRFREEITITVNFPALTDLVAYLREQKDLQTQIDSLATLVNSLTVREHTATAALDSAVKQSS